MNVKALTAQSIFDTVYRHLLKQNARSEDGRTCLYRGPNGTQCAVGCLLTDSEVEQIGNKTGVVRARMEGNLPGRLWEHVDLLQELQGIHDRLSPYEWKAALTVLARTSDLTVPE